MYGYVYLHTTFLYYAPIASFPTPNIGITTNKEEDVQTEHLLPHPRGGSPNARIVPLEGHVTASHAHG